MHIKGTFEVQSQFEPPLSDVEGVVIGRARFTKQFSGPLSATSTVEFLHASAQALGSGTYVAIERITGTLDGKQGSFAVHHVGLMERGKQSLTIRVITDSGTGALKGLTGTMTIDIVEKQHHYGFNYTLPG